MSPSRSDAVLALAFAFAGAGCVASAPPRARAALVAPLQCTPDRAASSDDRARAVRAEQCAPDHWLGRIGIPCLAAMRYYAAGPLEALSACTDRVFASPPPGLRPDEIARRAGHDCTGAILRAPPAEPCGRRLLARAVCEQARRCDREARVPGCIARGEAELLPAIADTVGLWNDTGRAALAECLGGVACERDPRRPSPIDCLAGNSTGGT